jgi:uncharacterized protein YaaN involved in tellurite resistance
MNDVLNPVEIEQQIGSIANDISRGVPVVSNAEAKAREARRVYDVAFKHAERTARALTEKLRAYQSIGASVRAMYSAPGGAV